MRRAFVVTAVCSLLSGCAYLSQFLSAAFKRPTFAFKNLALSDASLSGITLDTVWKLDNPNPVGLSLASIDYALAVEDKQVVSGGPRQGLQIAAQGSSDLHFPANLKFQDLFGVVQTFLNKDNARYRASGSLGVQTPIGVIQFPLAAEGTFEVPKIPAIQMGNPRVSSVTFQGATVEFPLTVTNKNSYPLPVAALVGNVTLAGANIGTITTGNLGDLQGRGNRQVSIPLTVNFLQAAGAATKLAQGGQAQVQFNAQLESGGQRLPINLNQLVNIQR